MILQRRDDPRDAIAPLREPLLVRFRQPQDLRESEGHDREVVATQISDDETQSYAYHGRNRSGRDPVDPDWIPCSREQRGRKGAKADEPDQAEVDQSALPPCSNQAEGEKSVKASDRAGENEIGDHFRTPD